VRDSQSSPLRSAAARGDSAPERKQKINIECKEEEPWAAKSGASKSQSTRIEMILEKLEACDEDEGAARQGKEHSAEVVRMIR
jgi:hypothetical protein